MFLLMEVKRVFKEHKQGTTRQWTDVSKQSTPEFRDIKNC